jgi:hypothetical protein
VGLTIWNANKEIDTIINKLTKNAINFNPSIPFALRHVRENILKDTNTQKKKKKHLPNFRSNIINWFNFNQISNFPLGKHISPRVI